VQAPAPGVHAAPVAAPQEGADGTGH